PAFAGLADHDFPAEQELRDRPVDCGPGRLIAQDPVQVMLVELRGNLIPRVLERIGHLARALPDHGAGGHRSYFRRWSRRQARFLTRGGGLERLERAELD